MPVGRLYVDDRGERAGAPTVNGDEPILCLVGDVDLANASGHADELCAVLDQLAARVLHIDCSRLDLLESQGMAMMVRVHRHGLERKIQVVWDGLAPRHRRVLDLTGLGGYLQLGPDGASDA